MIPNNKYTPLAEVLKRLILLEPPNRQNTGKKAKIVIKHSHKWEKPEGWPGGRIAKEDSEHRWVKYTAEKLLDYLHDKGYTSYSSASLRAKRQSALTAFSQYMNSLIDVEKSLWENVGIVIKEK